MDYLDRFQDVFKNQKVIYAPSFPILTTYDGQLSEMIFFYIETNGFVSTVGSVAFLSLEHSELITKNIEEIISPIIMDKIINTKIIDDVSEDEYDLNEDEYLEEYEKIIETGQISSEQWKKIIGNLSVIIPRGGIRELYKVLAKDFFDKLIQKSGHDF